MSKLEISKKVSGKIWEDACEKALDKAVKNAKVDGFRKGKVTKEMFLKKFGKEYILDAADIVLQDVYNEVIDENSEKEIVSQPVVNIKSIDDKGCEFSFVLVLKPEVKLGKYKKLGIKKEEISVTKEEIKKAIDDIRSKFSENVVKEGNVSVNDIAIIDFEGFKEGIAFDGGKGEDYSLTIGSNTFIPGFEEQLVGMKIGEEKEVNVTFPEEYHSEDLKGQPVVFKVKLKDLKEVVKPELTKEFFDDLAYEGVETPEALEKMLEENIKAQKEHHLEDEFIDKLLDAATANMEVEVPDEMINEEQTRMIKQYEENLKMQGLTLEQFYQFTSSNEQALKDQMKEEALKRVKSRLLLEAISKAEKIEIDDKDAEAEADNLALKYKMEKEEFLNLFGGLDMVKYDLKMRKAIEVLKDNN